MTRNVDLAAYLPPFMADFREMDAALTAENPEFKIVWDAAERVLNNEFIATADEYGISRFERLLKIYPAAGDTLEDRRARVQARWFSFLPYTWRMLIEKLILICGDGNFALTKNFLFYKFTLEVYHIDQPSQIAEIEYLLDTMIPCNMTVEQFRIHEDLERKIMWSAVPYLGGSYGVTALPELVRELPAARLCVGSCQCCNITETILPALPVGAKEESHE